MIILKIVKINTTTIKPLNYYFFKETLKMTTITINSNIKNVLDKESSRYALGNAVFCATSETEGKVFATNGRAVSVTPIEIKDNKLELYDCKNGIPSHVVPTTKSKPNLYLDTDNRTIKNDKHVTDSYELEGRFPKMRDVFSGCLETIDRADRTIDLSIDAKLLFDLAIAITPYGENKIITLQLAIDDDTKQIRDSIPVAGKNGLGIIMPCCSDNDRAADNSINNQLSELANSPYSF